MIALVQEAIHHGARLSRACNVIGISARAYQRWLRSPSAVDGRKGPSSPPRHKLTTEEEQAIVKLVNGPRYRNLSPEQVVAQAADDGIYIASERSIRRVLTRHQQNTYRNRAKPAQHHKPREFVACKAMQVLTWDITFMRNSLVRGQYFYMYLFIDVWSRRILGAEVHEEQSAEHAARLLQNISAEHGVEADDTVLHADNGGPMKGATMLATMHELGIVKSFSRPGCSDDNPFVESLFRHLKYAPNYPTRGFQTLGAARSWVAAFVDWYNHHHLHSAIAFVPPAARHDGLDIAILEQRRDIYRAARERNPRRWTRTPRRWDRPAVVMLNPDRVVETRAASTKRVA